MAVLIINDKYLVLSRFNWISITNTRGDSILLTSQNGSVQKFANILDACFSVDKSFFAVCDNDKNLYIYDTSNWSLLKTATSKKRCTAMVFTKDKAILLADKSGDVYEYCIQKNTFTFLLGHVSMLLDLTLGKDDDYVITCDRDEKIRVSLYPACYNIQEFCLFHTDFVSQVVYSKKQDLLFSGSGDGYIALWDYLLGSLLKSVDCLPLLTATNQIDETKRCKFAVYYLNEGVGGSGAEGAANRCRGCDVKKMAYSEEMDLLAVAFERWSCVLLFKVNEKNCIFFEKLTFEANILNLAFHFDQLFVFQDSEERALCLHHFKQSENNYKALDSTSTIQIDLMDNINAKVKLMKWTSATDSEFGSLHKIHIDNMTEYVEKKKKRILEKESKSSVQDKRLLLDNDSLQGNSFQDNHSLQDKILPDNASLQKN